MRSTCGSGRRRLTDGGATVPPTTQTSLAVAAVGKSDRRPGSSTLALAPCMTSIRRSVATSCSRTTTSAMDDLAADETRCRLELGRRTGVGAQPCGAGRANHRAGDGRRSSRRRRPSDSASTGSSSTPVPWSLARRTPPARTASRRPGTPIDPCALTSIGSTRSPSSRRCSTSTGSRPASERSHSRRLPHDEVGALGQVQTEPAREVGVADEGRMLDAAGHGDDARAVGAWRDRRVASRSWSANGSIDRRPAPSRQRRHRRHGARAASTLRPRNVYPAPGGCVGEVLHDVPVARRVLRSRRPRTW